MDPYCTLPVILTLTLAGFRPNLAQGCVVIFLSNFLALLIKVDAAGEGNRAALGGIMIAINVLLIVAVLATSWFATQQSVDDSREEESSLTLAKTMLTFEQRTADSARLARDEKEKDKEKEKAPSSSSVGSAGLLRASGGSVGPRPSRAHPGGGGGGGKNVAGAGITRGGSVSAATVKALWEEGKTGGNSTFCS